MKVRRSLTMKGVNPQVDRPYGGEIAFQGNAGLARRDLVSTRRA